MRAAIAARETLLQTLEPDNPVLTSLIVGDRDAFLAQESDARLVAGMPPFGSLAAIIIASPHEDRLHQTMRQLLASRPHFDSVQIFGPAIAPIGFLRGKHRARILISANKSVNIQHILKDWLSQIKLASSVRMQIDIDPYSFL